jgi:hypothetical protein
VSGRLRFGLFPLGLAGSPDGVASGPPDDFAQIAAAVRQLQGDGPPLLVRMYVSWTGAGSSASVLAQVAALVDSAVSSWDLVLAYRDPGGDVAAWTEFVARVVERYGRQLEAIQVTGEANLTSVRAAADGAFPNATEAFVQGVLAALGGDEIAAVVDYAGLDMYPDVFGPRFELEQLDGAVDWLLRSFREQALPLAGIGHNVPIRICENGWPTGAGRSESRQADVLESVLRAVDARASELGVTHWELFTLRDADSSKDDLFHNFGILRDDYSPKPAYDRLARLFAELG